MVNSKRVFLAVAVILSVSVAALPSGGGICDDLGCNSFFAPEITQNPAEAPLFRMLNTRFPAKFTLDLDNANLAEWEQYFGKTVSQVWLKFLLYDMSADDMPGLIASIEGRPTTANGQVRQLGLALRTYRNRAGLLSALDYIRFAKKVEPLATKNSWSEWSYPRRPKPVVNLNWQEAIAEAEGRIPRADRFLSARYRFQVLRILFYEEQYGQAQKYYEGFERTFTVENSVKYRFIEMGAGAYYKQKKYGQANYLYSLVFDKFPALKTSSFYSFHPVEDADWNQTLALAKNTHEKEVLWQMLGIYVDGMAAIDKIYEMNPRSQLLPLLLVREVNIAEEGWTANQSVRAHEESRIRVRNPRSDADAIGVRRIERIRAIADAGNTYKPYLWLLSTGHLMAMAGDFRAADDYLNRAERAIPNVPEIRAQLRMSQFFKGVRALQAIDKTAEPWLAQELEWLRTYTAGTGGREGYPSQLAPVPSRAVNLKSWALQYLSDIYSKGGDPIRALLLQQPWRSDFYQTMSGVDQVLAFMQRPENDFDRFLVRNYSHTIENVQEIRATHFLYAGEFTRALETFKLAGNVEGRWLNADPFVIHIKDCHDCDFQAPHTKYTKVTFTERMLALSNAARGQGQPAAQASFELANGFYNMSFYGNGRDIYDTQHDDLSIAAQRQGPNVFAVKMDRARTYYLRAAGLSSDKEFRAKAIFMAAKTEQRDFESTGGDHSRAYFQQLKDSFSDTQYYQEIIRECGYFAKWLQ